MIDVRCKNCNKLLAKAESMNAAIKCHGCYMIFEYKIFSNLFVTTQYDAKVFTKDKHNDIVKSESDSETISH